MDTSPLMRVAAVAAHQLHPVVDERLVVGLGVRVEQVNARNVAFITLGRRQSG